MTVLDLQGLHVQADDSHGPMNAAGPSNLSVTLCIGPAHAPDEVPSSSETPHR